MISTSESFDLPIIELNWSQRAIQQVHVPSVQTSITLKPQHLSSISEELFWKRCVPVPVLHLKVRQTKIFVFHNVTPLVSCQHTPAESAIYLKYRSNTIQIGQVCTVNVFKIQPLT